MVSLTPDLELALELSLKLAAECKHEYATLEHLLLALVDDKDAAKLMIACQVDIEQLRSDILDFLSNECGDLVAKDGQQVHPTAAFQRVVQRSVLHVESSIDDGQVSGANVLVAIFAEKDSHAAEFLSRRGMTRDDAVARLGGDVSSEPRPSASGAVAKAGTPPFYLIRINEIETLGAIGVHAFEQGVRQRLMVSVTLMVEPPPPGDQIDKVLNYDFVLEGVSELVANRHFNLQETLCGLILDLCLEKPGVLGAVVQTDKPDVYPGVAQVACRRARMGPKLQDFPWWELPV